MTIGEKISLLQCLNYQKLTVLGIDGKINLQYYLGVLNISTSRFSCKTLAITGWVFQQEIFAVHSSTLTTNDLKANDFDVMDWLV